MSANFFELAGLAPNLGIMRAENPGRPRFSVGRFTCGREKLNGEKNNDSFRAVSHSPKQAASLLSRPINATIINYVILPIKYISAARLLEL